MMSANTESSLPGDSLWKLIDRETTLARLAHDESLFGDLVAFFLEDNEPIRKAVGTAVGRADASALERAAHSMKGMAANLGATAVAQAAGELEAMGRSGNLKHVAAKEQALGTELDRLILALRGYQSATRGTA